MCVEEFDMEAPLATTRRELDVLDIDVLWRQIGDTGTDQLVHEPETLRVIMSGLDYFVARHEKTRRVIGAVSLMNCQRGLYKIDSLAVLPSERRSGIGSALVSRAIEHTKFQGAATVLTLATPASQKLFHTFGFEYYEMHSSGNADMFLDLKT